MKLKIPPVLVFVIYVVLMHVFTRFLPVGNFDFFGRTFLMYGLCLIAIVISFISLLQFFRSKTTVDPAKPDNASKLVTAGVYQFSRNPMYLGLLLLLLALGLWLGNAFNVLLPAGFVFYMNKFQIVPEEEALLKKFGKDYSQYCTLVRRWF